MRIWKGQATDLEIIIEFYKEAHQELDMERMQARLAIAEDQPEGIYLMGEKDYPYLACVVTPWRKATRISRVITTLEDDSADFSHYLKQFISMFLHRFDFGEDHPLFWFTRSDFVQKIALNVGFDIYTELVEYRKNDFRIPPFQVLPVTIRFFQEDDLDQLIELEQQVFMPEFWNDRENFRQMAVNGFENFLVAEMMDQVIGYIYSVQRNEKVGHLVRLGVHMDYQGLGIGKVLTAEGIKWFQDQQVETILLNVRGENLGARILYEKFGFMKMDLEYMLRYIGGGI